MIERYPDGTPKIPKQACLRCGYDMDAATNTLLRNNVPKPGHIALCFNCGHAMQFGPDMRHIEITPEVWAEMRKQRGLIRQILGFQAQIRKQGDQRKGRA
ncbi:MAG TPA: hypothetical protein VHT52_24275 [Stellaceae bacterium]|jgi:Zn ribbon nucleic-acid-binding protein|nr:hypothetical protein [Stellaceae bacterium]